MSVSLSDLKVLLIKQGVIFRMELTPKEGVTPKKKEDISRSKYFVILGKDKDSVLVGAVLINTNINYFLTQKLAPYQIILSADDYEFLKGETRFLNCYEIKKIPFNRILNEAEFIGELSDEIIDKAIELVNKSEVNSNFDLKKFGIFRR